MMQPDWWQESAQQFAEQPVPQSEARLPQQREQDLSQRRQEPGQWARVPLAWKEVLEGVRKQLGRGPPAGRGWCSQNFARDL